MGVLNMNDLRIFMLNFRYWFSLLSVLWGMYICVEIYILRYFDSWCLACYQ